MNLADETTVKALIETSTYVNEYLLDGIHRSFHARLQETLSTISCSSLHDADVSMLDSDRLGILLSFDWKLTPLETSAIELASSLPSRTGRSPETGLFSLFRTSTASGRLRRSAVWRGVDCSDDGARHHSSWASANINSISKNRNQLGGVFEHGSSKTRSVSRERKGIDVSRRSAMDLVSTTNNSWNHFVNVLPIGRHVLNAFNICNSSFYPQSYSTTSSRHCLSLQLNTSLVLNSIDWNKCDWSREGSWHNYWYYHCTILKCITINIRGCVNDPRSRLQTKQTNQRSTFTYWIRSSRNIRYFWRWSFFKFCRIENDCLPSMNSFSTISNTIYQWTKYAGSVLIRRSSRLLIFGVFVERSSRTTAKNNLLCSRINAMLQLIWSIDLPRRSSSQCRIATRITEFSIFTMFICSDRWCWPCSTSFFTSTIVLLSMIGYADCSARSNRWRSTKPNCWWRRRFLRCTSCWRRVTNSGRTDHWRWMIWRDIWNSIPFHADCNEHFSFTQ